MFMNTFSVYDTITYKKTLEKHHKKSDLKWKKLLKILTCRLINFGNQFYDDKLISVETGIIFKDYCLFQVNCTFNNKQYLFIATQKNDNLNLLCIKSPDNTYEKFFHHFFKS